ncbi:hypothetical protein [Haemophilus haemolyticus]|jgi:hypothetical protein|uniref:hypothetical protein n=1 Tax=Haemophilus haemolyticus TaxID=726 RepID=UPI001864CD3D|nr:hypothetical protein [Haemophilus haemolyticus]
MYYRAYLKNETCARLDVDLVTTSLSKMINHIRANYGKGWTATIYKNDETIKRWTLRK